MGLTAKMNTLLPIRFASRYEKSLHNMTLLKIYIYHLFYRLIWFKDKWFRVRSIDEQRQTTTSLLWNNHRGLRGNLSYREKMKNHECKVYSQNGEDGLLLFIFSQVDTTNRTLVEFGIETGRECNAANLLIHFGWNGLLMDGSPKYARRAREYYDRFPHTQDPSLKIQQSFVTVENINKTLSDNQIQGEIDLLSIDIDGNDYWVWEAINVVDPRVVVIEINASFGPDRAITVEYDEQFRRFSKHRSGWYHGASLAALEKLGARQGYSLVAVDSTGSNAFFVKTELLADTELQQVSAVEAFYPQKKRTQIASLEKQLDLIKHLPLVDVD